MSRRLWYASNQIRFIIPIRNLSHVNLKRLISELKSDQRPSEQIALEHIQAFEMVDIMADPVRFKKHLEAGPPNVQAVKKPTIVDPPTVAPANVSVMNIIAVFLYLFFAS